MRTGTPITLHTSGGNQTRHGVPKKTEQEYFMSDKTKTKSVVAIIGATVYTGRFVIAELLRRGMTPIAIARDANALSAANLPENEVYRRQASLNDAVSLDRGLHEAQAVIKCAGPFVATADAVVSAAFLAGIPYVDVAAERVIAGHRLGTFHTTARNAGITAIHSQP